MKICCLFAILLVFLSAFDYASSEEDEIIDSNAKKDLSRGIQYNWMLVFNHTPKIRIVLHIFKGFGEDINWLSFSSGLAEAQLKLKPTFLLIHKTWCGACQSKQKTCLNFP